MKKLLAGLVAITAATTALGQPLDGFDDYVSTLR